MTPLGGFNAQPAVELLVGEADKVDWAFVLVETTFWVGAWGKTALRIWKVVGESGQGAGSIPCGRG
jgi:hypothetical protein